MTNQAVKPITSEIDADLIREYLSDHPDFFHHHLDILENLYVPHPTGDAISLVERQISLLRNKNQVLERQLSNFIKAANSSESAVSRLHHLALELMHSDCLDATVASCQAILRNEFNADHVVLRLIGQGEDSKGLHFIAKDSPSLKHFEALFQKREAVCGRLRPKQELFLFGKNHDAVRSAVLIPLYEGKRIGVLALGSCDEHRFNPAMGTLFINYLGELVSRALALQLH
jgi:uncharacterized protein YigA (DUF484 family)